MPGTEPRAQYTEANILPLGHIQALGIPSSARGLLLAVLSGASEEPESNWGRRHAGRVFEACTPPFMFGPQLAVSRGFCPAQGWPLAVLLLTVLMPHPELPP